MRPRPARTSHALIRASNVNRPGRVIYFTSILFHFRQAQPDERARIFGHFFALGGWQRDQAALGEVAVIAPSLRAGEVFDEAVDAGDEAGMIFFDIKEQGSGDGIFSGGDIFEAGHLVFDDGALELAAIIVEEAEAENAERVFIGEELLHDEVVIFAGLNENAILPDRMCDGFEGFFIFFCAAVRVI